MNATNLVSILQDTNGRYLDGACSKCCHCGMRLTDAVSIDRGIGPVCSRKGYLDEPRDGDHAKAMAMLAAYPELLDYLITHYYAQNGARGFMNGLVRVCSLNRGDMVLHDACSNAVEALGWNRLADALRESLAVLDVKKVTNDGREFYHVHVKARDFKWSWNADMRAVVGARFTRHPTKHWEVPAASKRALWETFLKHYEGKCGKIVGGTGFRIVRGKVTA